MLRKLRRCLLGIVPLAPVVSIVCQAQSPPPLTRHVRDAVINGQARQVGRLPATQTMRLVLVLPHSNEAELQGLLRQLYDPASPSYHHYFTVEEFTGRFGPSQADYDAVIGFAQARGLTVVGTSRNRMNLDVTGPVVSVEAALHVTMGVYQHPTEDRTFYAPDREPTPDLPVPLWHIAGLDNYSIPRPALVRRPPGVQPAATIGSCPSQSFCGSDMRAAYYGGTLTGSGQSLGLVEYYGTDLTDLTTYFTNAGQTNNVPITLLSTDGTSTTCLESHGCDDTEQTIDMTQALGMAPGLISLVMYIGSTDSAIFNAMATASPPNAQLSCGWSWSPADPDTDNPYFEEFAAQGQNLFQSAGDSAKWTPSSLIYPADDVYLTSVGGTDLETSGAGGPWSSETAWVDGGGGISPNLFAIPSWQVTTAAGCAPCSQTYRNGPDVSANANFTFYVCADQTACTANEYGGNSFSAPMWAGYLALANQQAVANGGNTLGFINPAIYTIGLGSSYATDFHDITSGSNGYAATTGYDLATGWGSPNGAGLINSLTGSGPIEDYVEVCKLSSTTNPVPATGTYKFTVTGSAFNSSTNPLLVPVGECSGPIPVTPSTSSTAMITELPVPGVGVSAITAVGYSAPPNSHEENLLESYDLQIRTATVLLLPPPTAGDTSTETIATFTNYEAPPGQLKVCKIAGKGVTANKSFKFSVNGGTSFTVDAGPLGQGGYCVVVPGTFQVGTPVTVAEPGLSPSYAAPSITVNGVSTLSAGCTPIHDCVVAGIGPGINEVSFTNSLGKGQKLATAFANLDMVNYSLVRQTAVTGTQSYMTYRADLLNRGTTAMGPITASVTSLDASTVRVVGQGALNFAAAPANGQVAGSGTFTILADPAVPVDFSKLRWTYQSTRSISPGR
jgi:pro-kumamolisin-like protein